MCVPTNQSNLITWCRWSLAAHLDRGPPHPGSEGCLSCPAAPARWGSSPFPPPLSLALPPSAPPSPDGEWQSGGPGQLDVYCVVFSQQLAYWPTMRHLFIEVAQHFCYLYGICSKQRHIPWNSLCLYMFTVWCFDSNWPIGLPCFTHL